MAPLTREIRGHPGTQLSREATSSCFQPRGHGRQGEAYLSVGLLLSCFYPRYVTLDKSPWRDLVRIHLVSQHPAGSVLIC